MSAFQAGDRVRINPNGANPKDKKEPKTYPYMAGMIGTVANVYSEQEITVEVDLDTLGEQPTQVHKEATRRLRGKLELSEEARKKLTDAELEFTPHFVMLLPSSVLEKI